MKIMCLILDIIYYTFIGCVAIFVGLELGRMGVWLWFRYEHAAPVVAILIGSACLGLIIVRLIIKWIETPPKHN